jgi:ComF family protein
MVGEAVKSLLAALFPSDCRFCQSSLFSFSRLPVCSSCIQSIQPIGRPRCNVCGDVLAISESAFGDAYCRLCSAEAPSYARAVNYGSYTGALRELIHLLKYGRVRAAAQPLGKLTAEACLQLEGDIDVAELLMIPVPAHKVRLRSRGFNQAELIARVAQRGIEEATGRRVILETTAMLRVRFADSQVALTAEERQKQIRGAFKVVARERVKGREILLVDDVLTTGATASECARELRQAGAARVWVVTPARALGQHARVDELNTLPVLPKEGGIGPTTTAANIPDTRKEGRAHALVSFLSSGSSSSLKGVARASLPLRCGKVEQHEQSSQGGQRAGWRLWASPL